MTKENVNGNKGVDRRQFIIKSAVGVLGLGALAGTCGVSVTAARNKGPGGFPGAGRPAIPHFNDSARFFKPHQYAAVATLAALIIPSDDEAGATEAGVVDYIDRITADSKEKQARYDQGLTWLDAFCKSRYGSEFLDLDPEIQMDLLHAAFDPGGSTSFIERAASKIIRIWQGLTGTRMNGRFLNEVREDVVDGFYSNPVSWQHVGYFGPPHPVGYLDFAEPPSSAHYIDSVRMVNNTACNTCHEVGEHPRGGFIDHTCTACHRPHAPWPHDRDAFYLEDHIGVVFSNPDRKKKESK
ncbi:gluconate 2-dehydrogenase subunit 3 family protein [Desulfosarcina sp.]|uniref:gluconate 2-dehydrogenase subunit 3 family protein n=1 Tax=Desulfosarcina sp. TaxID=2027861 RepID=UPI0039706878